MIPVLIYTDGREEKLFSKIFDRRVGIGPDVDAVVRPILEDVRIRGDVAVYEQTVRHDGLEIPPDRLKLTAEDIESAYEDLDAAVFRAFRAARDNVRNFHKKELPKSWRHRSKGQVLGQDFAPIERVGVYVPGGQAVYASMVLQTVIPARVAGVREVYVVTPPRSDGVVPPAVRVMARECGVDAVFRVGGAQAVAALAYGTKVIPRVDKIVGPGNAYVQAAKRLVMGQVGIDGVAGPSEVVILADKAANPKFVAADLLAQAEHDPHGLAICITDSSDMVTRVQRHVKLQIVGAERQPIVERALRENGAIILVDKLATATRVANRIAPGHLELLVQNPAAVFKEITNAGVVSIGPWSPPAMGDHWVGPSHVLPTSGTARFASALSVHDFLRRRPYVALTRQALLEAAPHAVRIASAEGLSAHARSIEVRKSR